MGTATVFKKVYAEEKRRGRPKGSVSDNTGDCIRAVQVLLSKEDALNTPLSVRSCCYHLLSLGLLKSTKQFAGMGKKITDARKREADDPLFLDDDCFSDMGRKEYFYAGDSNVYEALRATVEYFTRDPWQDQATVPIVICEKAGHGPILSRITNHYNVRLFCSTGGFGRAFLVRIAKAINDVFEKGKDVAVGYMGDFDATGLVIERACEGGLGGDKEGIRDILRRKFQYDAEFLNEHLTFKRIGLTEAQFRNLPEEALVDVKERFQEWDENKEKAVWKGDPNAPAYQAVYGDKGAEVEALGFDGMRNVVRDFIVDTADPERWERSISRSDKEKQLGLEVLQINESLLKIYEPTTEADTEPESSEECRLAVCKWCSEQIEEVSKEIGWVHKDKNVDSALENDAWFAAKALCEDGKHRAEPEEEVCAAN